MCEGSYVYIYMCVCDCVCVCVDVLRVYESALYVRVSLFVPYYDIRTKYRPNIISILYSPTSSGWNVDSKQSTRGASMCYEKMRREERRGKRRERESHCFST